MLFSHSNNLSDRPYPGDQLIAVPRKIITHSKVINSPADLVWPWLVQMGSGRAGWYSYDAIDNGGRPSQRRIVPELQHVEVGDIVPAVPNSKDAFVVGEIKTGHALILVVPVKSAVEEPDAATRLRNALRVSWALILEKIDDGHTRLISRGRISAGWLAPSAQPERRRIFIERVYGLFGKMPWFLVLPVALLGHYVMESHMLRGIKARAEGTQSDGRHFEKKQDHSH